MELDTIVCGDCLDVMADMPDKSIDLVLTDPPYGISICRNAKLVGIATNKSRKATTDTWDDMPPTKKCFDEIKRISKNQIIFGANYFWENFYSSSCYIVWDKRGNMPDVPFAPTEFAWTSFVGKPSKRYVIINHGFIRDSKDEKTGHPTQKPSELFIAILRDFSIEDQIIFDPFMGSGTTAVAALKLGRHFYGCDINPEYVKLANERIKKARLEMAQLRMTV